MKSNQAPPNKASSVCSYRKVIATVAVLIGLGAAVYMLYFKHGAPEDILAANMARRSHGRTGQGRIDADYYDYEDGEEETGPLTPESTKKKWERWIRKNNYVSIGDLFNKCDGDDRLLVGKVLLQPDTVNGGVKSRTYLNHTLEQEVTGGEMYIEVQYNHKDLYSNHWELCDVEEGMDDRIIFCPIKSGAKTFVKDLPIPSYLPKGIYTTKAWLQDQDENLLGCAYSEFTL